MSPLLADPLFPVGCWVSWFHVFNGRGQPAVGRVVHVHSFNTSPEVRTKDLLAAKLRLDDFDVSTFGPGQNAACSAAEPYLYVLSVPSLNGRPHLVVPRPANLSLIKRPDGSGNDIRGLLNPQFYLRQSLTVRVDPGVLPAVWVGEVPVHLINSVGFDICVGGSTTLLLEGRTGEAYSVISVACVLAPGASVQGRTTGSLAVSGTIQSTQEVHLHDIQPADSLARL
jgi:hypothetical protein